MASKYRKSIAMYLACPGCYYACLYPPAPLCFCIEVNPPKFIIPDSAIAHLSLGIGRFVASSYLTDTSFAPLRPPFADILP